MVLFSSFAAEACPRPSLKEAAAIDIASTLAVISQGGRELNPLGVVGATLVKSGVIYNEEKIDPSVKTLISSVWTGAGIHNVMILFGSAVYPAILVGISVAVFINNNQCQKENKND